MKNTWSFYENTGRKIILRVLTDDPEEAEAIRQELTERYGPDRTVIHLNGAKIAAEETIVAST